MISIKKIQKHFKKLEALHQVNAELHAGQVISLIGPNGSGKTTLIKSILGLVKPDSGNILFNGVPINNNVNYRSRIGYMPQIGRYPDNMKIGQLFNMIKNLRGKEQVIDEELYYQFGLDKILDKSMRTLSGGTRQKVSAALAFMFNPEVLILDEPTAGLDPLSSEILKDKVIKEKEKGKLILITSHVLSDLEEITTDVMYLQDGKLMFFNPLEKLQLETGEIRLARIISFYMKHGLPSSLKVAHLKIAGHA